MRHLTRAEDITKDFFSRIYEDSLEYERALEKGIKKFQDLRGRCIVNLFFEPSTRTRSSFEKAGKYLSADVINISESASSVKKGETLIDTLKTLDSMYPDIIVLRHPCEGVCEVAKRHVKASIVNAGDGRHQHPTQALLDAITLLKEFGSLESANITIVGDIANSRVARSQSVLFRMLGANVFVYAPPTMLPRNCEVLGVKVLSSFEEVFEITDILVLLRIQLERQNAKKVFPSLKEYSSLFGLDGEKLKRFKKRIAILHPGPYNRGVELNWQVLEKGRQLIFTQVKTGIAVRMAVLKNLIFL